MLAVSDAALGQSPLPALGVVRREHAQASVPNLKAPGSREALAARTPATLNAYVDPLQGLSSDELVRRALAANADLSAVRLDIERGRARLRQADFGQIRQLTSSRKPDALQIRLANGRRALALRYRLNSAENVSGALISRGLN